MKKKINTRVVPNLKQKSAHLCGHPIIQISPNSVAHSANNYQKKRSVPCITRADTLQCVGSAVLLNY